MLGTVQLFVSAGLIAKEFEIHLIGYVVIYTSLAIAPAILTLMSTRLQRANCGLAVGSIILGVLGIFVYAFVVTEAAFWVCEKPKATRIVGTIGVATLLFFEIMIVLTSAFEVRRARRQKKQRSVQALPMNQVFAPPQFYPMMVPQFVPQYRQVMMMPMPQAPPRQK